MYHATKKPRTKGFVAPALCEAYVVLFEYFTNSLESLGARPELFYGTCGSELFEVFDQQDIGSQEFARKLTQMRIISLECADRALAYSLASECRWHHENLPVVELGQYYGSFVSHVKLQEPPGYLDSRASKQRCISLRG